MAWDKSMLETWHKLLSIFAAVFERTAVMPLFECAGILDPRGRHGWTLYPEPPPRDSPTPPSRPGFVSLLERASNGAHITNLLDNVLNGAGDAPAGFYPNRPQAERAACVFRLGEGCFAKLGFPEELAALSEDEKHLVDLPTSLFTTSGVAGILRHLRNVTSSHGKGSPSPTALMIDLTAIASSLSEDAIRLQVDTFLNQERMKDWVPHGQVASRWYGRRLSIGDAPTRDPVFRHVGGRQGRGRGGRGGGGRGGGGRGRGGGGDSGFQSAGRGFGRGPGRGGSDDSGKGSGKGAGRGGSNWLKKLTAIKAMEPGPKARPDWIYALSQATCGAMLKDTRQPYVC